MPTNRRVSRVIALIQQEISQMVLHEIKDDRVGAEMVSVIDVDVSGGRVTNTCDFLPAHWSGFFVL